MAINKVMYGSQTLIDLTNLTVSADKVATGITAIDKAGNVITGTMESSTGESTKAMVGSLTATPSSNSTSISFTGLKAEPKAFMVMLQTQLTNTSTRYVTGVMSDGTNTSGTYAYQQNTRTSGYTYVSSSYFSYTYSNGTLTVKTNSSSNGGYFKSGSSYKLIYCYEEQTNNGEDTNQIDPTLWNTFFKMNAYETANVTNNNPVILVEGTSTEDSIANLSEENTIYAFESTVDYVATTLEPGKKITVVFDIEASNVWFLNIGFLYKNGLYYDGYIEANGVSGTYSVTITNNESSAFNVNGIFFIAQANDSTGYSVKLTVKSFTVE